MKQAPHCLNAAKELVEFCKFAPGERFPTRAGPHRGTEAKEEPANFVQAEACLPRPLDHGEAAQRGRVIAALAADARRRQE